MIKYLFILLPLFARAGADYTASSFGIRSDGSTLNTRSIQYAVDYIHGKGGGKLVFEVGRYLTGSVHLKSNVCIELREGAVLLGSLNPFDYDKMGFTALLLADSAENITITGKGIIDGQGRQVAANIVALVHNGVISDPLKQDRPNEANRPMLIYFRNCSNVTIKNITVKNSACWVQTYDQCRNLVIDSIHVDSKAYWNNDGIDMVDCNQVQVTNCFIDAADDGICLKSHSSTASCNGVLIRGCTIRSSASAIKFGTASYGGFRHVRIIHNKIYDTYRSAIALEAVDGGSIEDVIVDSLEATNVGNAIFMRVGNRNGNGKSRLSGVQMSHFTAEIAAGKADAGYEYEGPVENEPRNISPVVMAGMPGALLSDIQLTDVTIRYPGGGKTFVANRGLQDSIPELPGNYPEFSMFKELPAWGLYIKHAKALTVKNLALYCGSADYRTAVVLNDVEDAQFEATSTKEPGNKKPFYQLDCERVIIK